MPAACPVHLILLDLITEMMFGEDLKDFEGPHS